MWDADIFLALVYVRWNYITLAVEYVTKLLISPENSNLYILINKFVKM